MATGNFILHRQEATQKIERMALQIAETLRGDDEPVILIGVAGAGTTIAHKVNSFLQKYIALPIEVLSVNLNKRRPEEVVLSKEINLKNKNIIIVDDVTNSGRTLLYALKPLLAFIPKRIQTLVIIERMHRSFPVKPDYVGLSVATPGNENIVVVIDQGEVTGAYIDS